MHSVSHRVPVNGTRLYVEDTGGDRPAVVFSHGLLLSVRLWDAQAEALRDRYRCIAYDHRGQGESEVPRQRSIDMDTCAADAAALIEKLAAGPCHFVGLSMGGFVGMRLAARRPELIRSLVLLETSAEPEAPRAIRRYKMLNHAARWLGPRTVADPVMRVLFGRTFLADPGRAAARQAWRERVAGNRRAIWRAVNGVIEREGVEALLASIRAPTLVGVGEEDVATPPPKALRIAAGIAGAQLVRFPAAGHSSPVEAPDAVTAALRAFLASVDGAAANA
ncbi:MAG: alpha/beta fold hydrolase [Anaeromyxobacter sp.]